MAAEALITLQALGADASLAVEQRGQVFYRAGQYRTATELLDQELEANPNNAAARYYRAMSLLRAGDEVAAVDGLRSLADRLPDSPFAAPALATGGSWYEEHGRIDDARRAYESLVQHYPTAADTSDARFRLGRLA